MRNATTKVAAAVRALAARMPSYITLKDVKKRWGKGQEDIFPVAQFEKLWGDMTALPELDCRFVVVPRIAASSSRSPRNSTAGCATDRRPIWNRWGIGRRTFKMWQASPTPKTSSCDSSRT